MRDLENHPPLHSQMSGTVQDPNTTPKGEPSRAPLSCFPPLAIDGSRRPDASYAPMTTVPGSVKTGQSYVPGGHQ
jgi:hypothetical protein